MKKVNFLALLLANVVGAQTITLVKDINAGAVASTPDYFTEYNGRLYFSAATAEYGTEVWSTDGTEAGTVILEDKIPGTSSFLPTGIKKFNNKLYIPNILGNTANPVGIYSYDGTTFKLATSVVKYPTSLTEANDKLFMGYNQSLYQMDKDEVFTNVSGGITVVNTMAQINGKLILAGKPTASTNNSYQLYKYDTDGISLLKTINPTLTANPQNFFYSSAVGKVFFCAGTQAEGFELWTTDGTTEGTALLKDLTVVPTSSSFPNLFTQVGNKIFFIANDNANGNELWVTDGTAEGTKMVKDIYAGSASSSPTNLTELNGKLYFFAKDASNEAKLWESDGTEAGTKVTLELRPGYTSATIGKMAVLNGDLYLSAKLYVDKGQELYKITVPTPVLAATDATKDNKVILYPNPTNGTLYFKNIDDGSFQLFDMNGRLIQSGIINKAQPAQLTAKSGVYQIRTTSAEGKIQVDKVIIK